MAKFNLDSIIGKCVHRPISQKDPDSLPLYKRNAGIFNADGSVGTRSEAWMKASQTNYSSPNNIRRVFITYKGVYIHLYRPMCGDKSRETAKFYSYESVNKDFKPMDLYRSRNLVSVTKTGFSAFKGQWSCSNIEEIYFDWTLLLSSDLVGLGLGGMLDVMTKPGTVGVQDGTVLWSLFNKFCLRPGENISKTFPRLKVIGYASLLDDIYNAIKRKPGEEDTEDLASVWCKNPVMSSAAKNPNCYVALYKVPNVSALNSKFLTRSFYTFDTEVLDPYFEKLKQKILKEMSEKRTGKAQAGKKSEFEKLLDTLRAQRGLEAAQKMCVLILSNSDADELKRNTLSEEGRKLYMPGGLNGGQ